MRSPEVQLLWWVGCPSTERALSELRAALDDLGLDSTEIRLREIVSDPEAQASRFKGSPTILIDGADLLGGPGEPGEPGEPDRPGDPVEPAAEPIGLTCRVYRRRDGRISPTPDPDDLRDALRRAAREEVTR